MSTRSLVAVRLARASILAFSVAALAPAGSKVTIEDVLSFKPVQRFVDYDTPDGASLSKCKLEVIREARGTGWVLRDPTGRLCRQFMDTNRDGKVDQWSYYHDGVEVYREDDTNSNGRADQFRWLNTAGTRWAADTNEDGKIDAYRAISAEEATREVVRALALRDPTLVEPILVRPSDAAVLTALATAEQIKESNAQAPERYQELVSKLGHLTGESRWVRLDGSIPLLIPGDAPDGSRDVQVYRDARAVIQTGARIDVLRFGYLVQIGKVWKVFELPSAVPPGETPLAGVKTIVANVPSDNEPATGGPAPDPQVQAILAQLQKLDETFAKNPGNDAAAARYQLNRADLLEQLVARAKDDQDRTEMRRQLADSLIASLQAEPAAETRERLTKLSSTIAAEDSSSPLISHIAFRQISADYARAMQQPGSDFVAVQKGWLEQLEKFVADFSESDDAPEALSQLAVGMEFAGKEDQAREYYKRLTDSFPNSPAAQRAAGALKRLELDGKPLAIKGSELRRGAVDIERFRGKVVLVEYWATWCEPCKADLPRLKQIYEKYRAKGFEVIAVSLDNEKADVLRFVQTSGMPWPVIFEGGGLESPLAVQFGIIALPTHFLVDAEGNVVSRTVSVSQLEDELKKLLK